MCTFTCINFHCSDLQVGLPADIPGLGQELRERGVKRPPPLREDNPRIVGGAKLETIPATTTIPYY